MRLVVVVLALAASLIAAPVASSAAIVARAPRTVAVGVADAARYATTHGMTSGVAVVDTRTGARYSAGNPRQYFVSASVVKALIATRLLLTGQMHGRTASLAHVMITQSDNDAATALYPHAGGDDLLPWLARHYRITRFGTTPTEPGLWGTTRITADGLAQFYAAVRADHRVWPWLSKAMHDWQPVSSGGEPNDFGIGGAAPASAVKNGWLDYDEGTSSEAVINTTGFVDGDRYAVAILAEGASSLYYRGGERIVTEEARLVMPGGRITPIPPPTVSQLSTATAPVGGGERVTVVGDGFTGVEAVRFGRLEVSAVRVKTAQRLVVTVPPHPAGAVHVRVVTAYGRSRLTQANGFRYVAGPQVTSVSTHSGAVAGGTHVVLTGRTFVDVEGVRVCGAAGIFHVRSARRITLTTQPHKPAGCRIVVKTRYGASSPRHFTYVAAPAVTLLDPSAGSAAGGDTVTITGTGFRNVHTVSFGGADATITAVEPTSLTMVTPAGPPGTVDVVVTTAYGTSTPVGFAYS